MASKRAHTKSRLGCKQCKSRRIKCDENPPRCGNCTQKSLECDFQQYAAVFDKIHILSPVRFPTLASHQASIFDKADVGGLAVQSPTGLPDEIQRGNSFKLQDLGLLHHFTLYTAPTIGAIQSDLYCHIWRYEVPRLAQSHGFLMHAMLGFAAAHRTATSTVHPKVQELDVIRDHYSQALSLFRDAVQQITVETAEPLLLFSILTSFLTLYLEGANHVADSELMSGVVSFFRVVQMSTQVLDQVRAYLDSSAVGVLLSHSWNKTPHAIHPEAESSLHTVDCLKRTYLSSTPVSHSSNASSKKDEATPLSDALSKLRRVFSLSDPKGKGCPFILAWPTGIDAEFVTLLREENPVALCALAHWFVPVFQAPEKWWVGEWPRRVLTNIARRLQGTTWEEATLWPMKETIGEIGLSGNNSLDT